ncbi:hypothetical protein PPTG_10757 [Phytophthora nicotianae INRA-310]|uniref:Uncharacterized protein n=1 Tax=Phytophthora nicotianae (strain INRA-310) TaxID=761204 RepID=W2Q9X8_PHYN3|nr:hypothetical protein PPTG_10757 [Phytophthora nicotianae INRA-310]ETN09983.1 hypothetical protein PPTG_10757 [Phytophthora nicotianae INRA-310]
MTDVGECLVSEAFNESESEADEEKQQTIVVMEDLESIPEDAQDTQRSALQTTLGVASSAANFVLYPYVAAGKVAVHATTMAVAAPIYLTNHVRASIAQSWTRSEQEEDKADLFGEHSCSSTSSTSSDNEEIIELLEPSQEHEESSGVAQLLFLPVRLVHSGVSTAVAIPTRVATYSGRKISGAVSTSHQLATSAVVASTGLVARTGMHVARGITHGAVSTASTISGAVGKTVSYVIPPSVSNAVWQGMDITGNASVNVLSHAIAVPSYRMLRALVPAVERCFTEEEAVAETRATVKMLVKVLGPQNAFYLLKWVYETVNSEEAHDAFLLCRDILHESLDGENYRQAGASVSAATGLNKVVHVMKEAYSVLPSLDELIDAAALVADVSDEVVDGVAHAVTGREENASRFEYVDDDDEPLALGPLEVTDATFERESSASSSDEELNPILQSSISMLTRVCDSEEASSLFNAFGDFLDVLVN